MLRIIQSNDVASAKSYLVSGLAREDYYVAGSEQEIVGRWGGKAAERLGLTGQVTHAGFIALCDNKHPVTGEKLNQRNREDRKVGYDVSWHAPKSVSVVYALTRDERILTAFRNAVYETMREMEADVRVRVRKNKENSERITGEAVWGEFIHFTARPVNGVPDPHVHAHCFVMNTSFDHVEGCWKAADIHVLKEDAPYFEAAMHARLARGLVEIGYGVTRTAKGWEIAGVPDSVKDKFSRRTAVIEAAAEKLGLTAAADKDDLGRRTRERKESTLGMEQLRKEWIGRLSTEERQALLAAIRGKAQGTEKVSPEQAMAWAALQSFERQSVVQERRLLGAALRYGVGSIEAEGLKVHLESPEWITRDVEGKCLVTTRAVLAEESRMVSFAREGRGTCRALAKMDSIRTDVELNAGQGAAAAQVLGSRDRVQIIRGAAGTGKTTLMRAVVSAVEAEGKQVIAVAPTAEASRGVLRADGFSKADTVAKLLTSRDLQTDLKGNVLWVDEAGLVGSQDMVRLFDLAKDAGARVILTGDSRQHAPVARADSLRILETQAGLPVAEVRNIVRQRGNYKEAVFALAEGNVAEGFDRLDAMGWVREIGDRQAREEQLAADYLTARHEGRSVLVIAPTHAEGRSVTGAIRGALEAGGKLGTVGRVFPQLVTDSPTEADRRDPLFYQPGQVVEFHLSAKGFKPGVRYQVESRDERGRVMVRQGDGKTAVLPLENAARFQVYTLSQLELRAGDRLRIGKNCKTADGKHDLHRGTVYDVGGFTKEGDVKLTNGWVLSKNLAHWSHGYVLTSHASQGKTVDRVLLAESEQSLPTASREQFYVSASRARESVTVYTDDKRELRRAIEDSSQRLSARELEQKPARESKGLLQRHAERLQRVAELARAYASQKVADVAGRYARMRGREQERER